MALGTVCLIPTTDGGGECGTSTIANARRGSQSGRDGNRLPLGPPFSAPSHTALDQTATDSVSPPTAVSVDT